MQIQRTGTADAHEGARKILVDARRSLYRILADDEEAEPSTSERPTRAAFLVVAGHPAQQAHPTAPLQPQVDALILRRP